VSVAFDASFLLPLLSPGVPGPFDPTTKKPLESIKERLDYLVEVLEKSSTKIIIPTPALSELLVRAGTAGVGYLERLRQVRPFKIESFDERAALEVALAIQKSIDQVGKKQKGKATQTWAKVKFDHQIVAIAKVNNATTLYSDDEGLRGFAEQSGLSVVRLRELELPPKPPQMDFNLKIAPKPPPES
jgi:hypothetical protein